MKGLHKNSLQNVENPHQWMIDDAKMEVIQQIRAEVESQRDVYNHPNRVIHGVADAFRQDGRAAMCNDILAILDAIQDKPVNNDFGDEVEKMRQRFPEVGFAKMSRIAHHFIEWQKQQDLEDKDTIEAKVCERDMYDSRYLDLDCDYPDSFKFGDKVIIIKK